ncbi:excitatory amino acid transporter 3-like isoform X1 [Poeciliopsis prolifica]|uniref:excitatory amino acid transporter 3-like isoform X1 n=1 Tax=Poeciliopsis prolifica TaxID=188132 RepID=UPI0024138938|nr:excitatory amino acid transporter 3-like isoform X1 [Poeciliopsis prolifica]
MKKSETIVQVFCLISVILGIGIGFLLRLTIGLKNKLLKDSMQIPGNILLAILQMFAVPLIVTSVLAGVTGLNTKMSKKIAIVTGAFVSIATILASSYAMILVLSVAPGKGVDVASEEPEVFIPFSMHLVFMDLLRNLFPENFLQAFFEQYKTEIVHVTRDLMIYPSPRNDTQMQLIGTYVPGANILGLIIWSFTIGVLINRVGHTAQSTVKAIQYINDAIKIIVRWFMWYLPIGVLFLIVDSVLAVEDWGEAYKLVKFVGVALVGLLTYGFIIVPMVYLAIVRENPYRIFKHVSRALSTAFLIASSTAALPIALQCCEENVKINKKILRLMLPIIICINMNGTAIYEVTASVFIAQINDIKLEVSQIISICMSTAIVTFGIAGVPVKGAVGTIMILTAVGLPAKDAVILVIFEWLLDHFTTLVNVLTNIMCLSAVNRLWEKDLQVLEEQTRTDKVRAPSELDLDLSCLEPDDEPVPSATTQSEPVLPQS